MIRKMNIKSLKDDELISLRAEVEREMQLHVAFVFLLGKLEKLLRYELLSWSTPGYQI